MPFAATWMDLESGIPSELSQRKTSVDITPVQTQKNDTNELIYKTNRSIDTENRFMIKKGEKGRGGINQEFEISRYTPQI